MSPPSILFGASSLGEGNFKDPEKAKELLQYLINNGITHFDTAAIYPIFNQGESEKILGDFQKSNPDITIDTKIVLTTWDGADSLSPEAIEKSVSTSISRVSGGLNVLYCHRPDPKTPIEVSAAALDQQLKDRKIKHLGLSNFPSDLVSAYIQACDSKHLTKPTVYEGQYNALVREPEKDLLPLLRRHGMKFMAYSPLAGGFLTGKLTNGHDVSGSRFDDSHPGAKVYKGKFDKPEMHAAVRRIEEVGKKHGIDIPEASLRWLYHHSALQEGDGIILGASKLEQVQKSLQFLNDGPLPQDLIEAFETSWQEISAAAAQ